MNKNNLFKISLVFFTIINLYSINSWDRYDNETEQYVGGNYQVKNIIKYSFYIPASRSVVFETTETVGDTFMYLWSNNENCQIANDDDGGVGVCSKISITLQKGSYTIFIRSNVSNTGATCSLLYNGIKVIQNKYFSGYKVDVSSFPAETRFKLKYAGSQSGGSNIFGILLNSNEDMIGYSNLCTQTQDGYVVAAEQPSYIIIGTDNPYVYNVGFNKIYATHDYNLEYLTLCGNETRHIVTGNSFISNFMAGTHFMQSPSVWQVGGDVFNINRIDWVDNVDLVYMHTHGAPGGINDFYSQWTDFTSPYSNAGSNNRTFNRSGDLEYIAFMSCNTVRIESETNFDWLIDRGWKTGINSWGSFNKGFFDGLHMVVGFHSVHTNYPEEYWHNSSNYNEAYYFAHNLNLDDTIWNSWKYAVMQATDDAYNWYWYMLSTWGSIDIGEASTIYITSQMDEKLSDFKSLDYKYGDSNYDLGWRKSKYWYQW